MTNFVFIYNNLTNGKTERFDIMAPTKKVAQDKWDRFVAPYNDYDLIACEEANLFESEEEEATDEYTTDDLGPDWW